MVKPYNKELTDKVLDAYISLEQVGKIFDRDEKKQNKADYKKAVANAFAKEHEDASAYAIDKILLGRKRFTTKLNDFQKETLYRDFKSVSKKKLAERYGISKSHVYDVYYEIVHKKGDRKAAEEAEAVKEELEEIIELDAYENKKAANNDVVGRPTGRGGLYANNLAVRKGPGGAIGGSGRKKGRSRKAVGGKKHYEVPLLDEKEVNQVLEMYEGINRKAAVEIIQKRCMKEGKIDYLKFHQIVNEQYKRVRAGSKSTEKSSKTKTAQPAIPKGKMKVVSPEVAAAILSGGVPSTPTAEPEHPSGVVVPADEVSARLDALFDEDSTQRDQEPVSYEGPKGDGAGEEGSKSKKPIKVTDTHIFSADSPDLEKHVAAGLGKTAKPVGEKDRAYKRQTDPSADTAKNLGDKEGAAARVDAAGLPEGVSQPPEPKYNEQEALEKEAREKFVDYKKEFVGIKREENLQLRLSLIGELVSKLEKEEKLAKEENPWLGEFKKHVSNYESILMMDIGETEEKVPEEAGNLEEKVKSVTAKVDEADEARKKEKEEVEKKYNRYSQEIEQILNSNYDAQKKARKFSAVSTALNEENHPKLVQLRTEANDYFVAEHKKELDAEVEAKRSEKPEGRDPSPEEIGSPLAIDVKGLAPALSGEIDEKEGTQASEAEPIPETATVITPEEPGRGDEVSAEDFHAAAQRPLTEGEAYGKRGRAQAAAKKENQGLFYKVATAVGIGASLLLGGIALSRGNKVSELEQKLNQRPTEIVREITKTEYKTSPEVQTQLDNLKAELGKLKPKEGPKVEPDPKPSFDTKPFEDKLVDAEQYHNQNNEFEAQKVLNSISKDPRTNEQDAKHSKLTKLVEDDIKRHDKRIEEAIRLYDDEKLKDALAMLDKADDKDASLPRDKGQYEKFIKQIEGKIAALDKKPEPKPIAPAHWKPGSVADINSIQSFDDFKREYKKTVFNMGAVSTMDLAMMAELGSKYLANSKNKEDERIARANVWNLTWLLGHRFEEMSLDDGLKPYQQLIYLNAARRLAFSNYTRTAWNERAPELKKQMEKNGTSRAYHKEWAELLDLYDLRDENNRFRWSGTRTALKTLTPLFVFEHWRNMAVHRDNLGIPGRRGLEEKIKNYAIGLAKIANQRGWTSKEKVIDAYFNQMNNLGNYSLREVQAVNELIDASPGLKKMLDKDHHFLLANKHLHEEAVKERARGDNKAAHANYRAALVLTGQDSTRESLMRFLEVRQEARDLRGYEDKETLEEIVTIPYGDESFRAKLAFYGDVVVVVKDGLMIWGGVEGIKHLLEDPKPKYGGGEGGGEGGG